MAKNLQELRDKLNAELDEFVSNLKPSAYKEGWSEDNWEQEMQQHPLFMTEAVKEGHDLPPLVEALQQLKYDPNENTASELAASYKEDGNENFKMKKYRWAVDSYTAGLKQNCPDLQLNARLYANRAAAHFYLGNFRSSLLDCISAKEVQPNYVKVIVRGALCCKELKLYDECISWCEEAMHLQANDASLTELKMCAEQEKVKAERDKRKRILDEKRIKIKEEALLQALRERNIRLQLGGAESASGLDLEPTHPAAVGHGVHFDDTNSLTWPVIFLYTEYGVTDVIQNFNECDSFCSHLDVMFPEISDLEWDTEKKYLSRNLQVYFESDVSKKLVKVHRDSTLKEVLSDERYIVANGTPIFFVVVKASRFDEDFRERHGIE